MNNVPTKSSSPHQPPSAWRRTIKFVLACLFLILWFGALDERELFHPDEGRYAEIPREMVASGDWITPRLNGLKYFEKPVLQYWITAVSYLALGREEFVARLWPALSGFLTLFLVYSTGRRLAGVRAGLVAAAVLATTFQFFVFSQILTLDMGLSFFLTLALYGFLASQDLRATAVQQRNWAVLMWVAMALAVLSKGLVGVVLPALVLVDLLRHRGTLRRAPPRQDAPRRPRRRHAARHPSGRDRSGDVRPPRGVGHSSPPHRDRR